MTTPFKRRRLGPLAASACLAALAAAPSPSWAATATYNVSQLVLGTPEPTPPGPTRVSACGGACRFASVSGTQMSNSYSSWPGAYSKAAWPVFYSNIAPLYGNVQDALAVAPPPAGTQYDGLANGIWQRSRVAFSYLDSDPPPSRQLDVQTFKSGNGASAASYAVRITVPPSGPMRTFLRFELPTQVRDGKQAGHVGGPSGDEPFTTWPKRLQTRTAVDVYVDGLPVWSSQSMQLLPQRYNPDNVAPISLDWGPTLDGGTATLFLGTLPANSVRSAVIVMRADLRVDAPTCHTDNVSLGDDARRCDARIEGLSLPSKSVAPLYLHTPDVSVYTR